MSRLKLAATAAAFIGGLAAASGAAAASCTSLTPPTHPVPSTCFVALETSGQLNLFNSALAAGTMTPIGGVTPKFEGLGQLNTTLYGEAGDTLYKITDVSGTLTEFLVGTAAPADHTTFVDFGSTTNGLFALGADGDLYSINKSTGAITTVGNAPLGSLGLGTFTARTSSPSYGLSVGGGVLDFVDGSTLYTLSTITGHATSLGSITVTTDSEFGALMFENGKLYAYTNNDGHGSHTGVVTLAFTGGHWVPTEISQSTNNSEKSFGGLAPGFGFTVLPEPGDWALMLFGVGAVGGALRGRRRKATAEA
jgi:hypothetical protein